MVSVIQHKKHGLEVWLVIDLSKNTVRTFFSQQAAMTAALSK